MYLCNICTYIQTYQVTIFLINEEDGSFKQLVESKRGFADCKQLIAKSRAVVSPKEGDGAVAVTGTRELTGIRPHMWYTGRCMCCCEMRVRTKKKNTRTYTHTCTHAHTHTHKHTH
jgi:hypothetical protein